MGIQTPINITPALAAQLVQITGGQADRAAEILQALTTLSDNTGADLTTLLNDIALVKGDTAQTLTDVSALPEQISAISANIEGQSRIMKNVLALDNNNRAPLLFQILPSSGQTVEAYNYNGSGRIYLAEFAGTHSIKVYVDGNLAIDFVGNVGSRSVHDLIDHSGENKTYLPDLYFSESLRVVVTNHEGIAYYTKFYGVLYS